MIVILEGVDGSGKTELRKQLVEKGYKHLYIVPCTHEWHSWTRAKFEFSEDFAICDRSFISDLVYRLYDGEPRRGADLHDMCSILETEVKIVHLESGTEFEDSMARGEDNILTKKANNKIKKLYRTIMDMIRIFIGTPILKYNWRKDNLDDVIKFIQGGT